MLNGASQFAASCRPRGLWNTFEMLAGPIRAHAQKLALLRAAVGAGQALGAQGRSVLVISCALHSRLPLLQSYASDSSAGREMIIAAAAA